MKQIDNESYLNVSFLCRLINSTPVTVQVKNSAAIILNKFVVVLVQLYMLFNFCMFHFCRFRERTKKLVKAKSAANKNQKKAKNDEKRTSRLAGTLLLCSRLDCSTLCYPGKFTFRMYFKEYFIDKMSRRLHLSKTRQTKSNESGQLRRIFTSPPSPLTAYIADGKAIKQKLTFVSSSYFLIIYRLPKVKFQKLTSTRVSLLISYWIHQFPEFYFQKLKRDEIRSRTVYSILFFGFTALAYFANFNRLALALLFLKYVSQSVFHLSRMLYFTGKIQSLERNFCDHPICHRFGLGANALVRTSHPRDAFHRCPNWKLEHSENCMRPTSATPTLQ
ncbi:translocating chain-associated membrane protein 1-like 1 [Ditylenchus destructor]|nr:translocating chain-associated membrane protein 1-like 1 [Ditylenchus destructor]